MVPEDVRRYWLYEHWDHSPYGWLPSAGYEFARVNWPANSLIAIRSVWCEFAADNSGCIVHGEHLITGSSQGWQYPTALYMAQHGDFPAPIIVLDNRNGHLQAGRPPTPGYSGLPAAYILVEGHRRFNMALYLHSVGRFCAAPRVWLMSQLRIEFAIEQNIRIADRVTDKYQQQPTRIVQPEPALLCARFHTGEVTLPA